MQNADLETRRLSRETKQVKLVSPVPNRLPRKRSGRLRQPDLRDRLRCFSANVLNAIQRTLIGVDHELHTKGEL